MKEDTLQRDIAQTIHEWNLNRKKLTEKERIDLAGWIAEILRRHAWVND